LGKNLEILVRLGLDFKAVVETVKHIAAQRAELLLGGGANLSRLFRRATNEQQQAASFSRGRIFRLNDENIISHFETDESCDLENLQPPQEAIELHKNVCSIDSAQQSEQIFFGFAERVFVVSLSSRKKIDLSQPSSGEQPVSSIPYVQK
jgi:hypothetical protein